MREKASVSSHGLVGYDAALTRQRPRVQFPLAVMFLSHFTNDDRGFGVLGFWGFGFRV